MAGVASWLPLAVADRLHANDAPLIAWLASLRAHVEDYDSTAVRTPSPDPPESPDSAFDEILSQLGNEIYKLDEYQRQLTPPEVITSVSHSILDLFDECLCDMTATETDTAGDRKLDNGVEDSEPESTVSDVSFVTSTPARNAQSPIGTHFPPRRRAKTSPSSGSISNNMDVDCKPRPTSTVESLASRLATDSDSESTCWSYKDCSTDTENDDAGDRYAVVWTHSSGYHNSDEILKRVLSQHHATESRLSFHVAQELSPPTYPVYALPELERCALPLAAMTPGAPDDYEPVRDAIDENIYEEIEYGAYTDEGYSCDSVDAESCSVSASSEGVGRESPVYANLRDHDAYAVPAHVIAWKNLLLHPDYNDDEEDLWITPEECNVFRDSRPPLVIPRISQHRARLERRPHQLYTPPFNYAQESLHEVPKLSARQYALREWSPVAERGRRPLDSPPSGALSKKLGGSTENLLIGHPRRPTHLQLPVSSSDSLDVDVRERSSGDNRNRKSRSMVVAGMHRVKSPVPAPRLLLKTEPAENLVIHEGPAKRTKFAESGKKCRKHWTDCYLTLTPTALRCYKDQKTYQATKISKASGTPPSPTAPRVELVLPLKNAHIMPCNHQHTSRFARSVVLTVGYDQYLIQDDTKDGAAHWLELVQNVIYKLGPPMVAEYPQYQSSNTDIESLGRTPPAARHPSRSKQKAGGSSNEDLSDSTEVSYVKSKLRKFFARRPAMEVLVKKGIYKDEPVFGRKLEEVCPPTAPRIPEFVVGCIREIERTEENMCTDGLYRASGNLSQVQKIRLEIDQNNLSVIENSPDIHVLTGSLKLFFRELKEPLIPCKLFDRILSACSIKPREARTKEFKEIIQILPACNRDTLKFLLEHLLRVTTYSERNRMHTANLAIVFGPTLLWAPAEQAHNIAVDCIQQNNVVDILLTDFKEIFAEESGKSKKKA